MDDIDYLITANPNVGKRKAVVNMIKANGGYCITQTERNDDTKCHCLHFKQTGECYCGLFIRVPVVEVTE